MAKEQRVDIGLFASDHASAVFQKVARNADAMGRSIDAAAKARELRGNWLASGSTAQVKAPSRRASSSRTPDISPETKASASSVDGLTSALKNSRLAVAAWGGAILLAGKQALDASIRVDRLEKAYTTITGSSSAATAQLDYMYAKTRELGLQFYDTAESSRNFFASMKGTAIEGEADRIWESVATAASALSLSQDDVESVYRSLGQMVSKGKVMAEELRGQLGERLPGAFQLAAKAMGVTTQELDKMLELGDVMADDMLPKLADEIMKAFGPGAQQAAEGLQQNMSRLSTEWERFKASILDSESVSAVLRGISDAMAGYNDFRQASQRKEQTVEEMRAARIVPLGLKKQEKYGFWGEDQSYMVSYYTDEQIAQFRAARQEVENTTKAVEAHAQRTDNVLAKASAATTKYLRYTAEGRRKALDEEYQATVASIDAAIASYKESGTSYENLMARRAAVDKEYYARLAALEKKNAPRAATPGRAASSGVDHAASALADLRTEAAREEARNLEIVDDALVELAEKSGQYGLSVQVVNRLIEEQVGIWRTAGVPEEYISQLAEIRRLESSNDGLDQMFLKWQEFAVESQNWGEQVGGVLTSYVDGFAGALANMAMTGKASFSDLATSAASSLTHIAMRMMLVYAIQRALGWATGSIAGGAGIGAAGEFSLPSVGGGMGLSFASVAHKGWESVGSSSSGAGRLVPSGLFAAAPRLHSGTGYIRPGEYPAILKAGERVLNPAETRAYQSGPRVNLIINNNASGVDVQTSQRENADGSMDIEATIVRVVQRDMDRRGGMLNQSMRKNWGQRSIITKR